MGMRGRGIGSAMDRQIQFQRATETTGSFGGSTLTWSDHGEVIAALRQDVKDEESVQAGVFRVRRMIRFQCRSTEFTRGITGDDRIQHEGELWGIVGIKEPSIGQRRQLLEFTVEGPIIE
jgi:head-tail adaptor